MSYPITAIAGIDGDVAAILKSVGIRSSARLLQEACTPKGRKLLAKKTGVEEQMWLCWANFADCMRVKGISRDYAALLRAAGVTTVKDLKCRNAANLTEAMAEVNQSLGLVQLLPSEKVVRRWIECAKDLEVMIRY